MVYQPHELYHLNTYPGQKRLQGAPESLSAAAAASAVSTPSDAAAPIPPLRIFDSAHPLGMHRPATAGSIARRARRTVPVSQGLSRHNAGPGASDLSLFGRPVETFSPLGNDPLHSSPGGQTYSVSAVPLSDELKPLVSTQRWPSPPNRLSATDSRGAPPWSSARLEREMRHFPTYDTQLGGDVFAQAHGTVRVPAARAGDSPRPQSPYPSSLVPVVRTSTASPGLRFKRHKSTSAPNILSEAAEGASHSQPTRTAGFVGVQRTPNLPYDGGRVRVHRCNLPTISNKDSAVTEHLYRDKGTAQRQNGDLTNGLAASLDNQGHSLVLPSRFSYWGMQMDALAGPFSFEPAAAGATGPQRALRPPPQLPAALESPVPATPLHVRNDAAPAAACHDETVIGAAKPRRFSGTAQHHGVFNPMALAVAVASEVPAYPNPDAVPPR